MLSSATINHPCREDDIEFDEEELRGERDGDRPSRITQTGDGDGGDTQMTSEQLSFGCHGGKLDCVEIWWCRSDGQWSPDIQTCWWLWCRTSPAVPTQVRCKVKISHDEYMSMQSMIVLHLNARIRETGKGTDRDELVDWYLEQKEDELHDVE
jgi:DNA replication licensing factor MCM6